MIQFQRPEGEVPLPALTPLNQKALLDHPAYLAVGMLRISVPQEKISWSVPWPEYDATPQQRFDHPVVLKEFQTKGARGWAAEPSDRALAGSTLSYVDNLPVNAEGEVLNPGGRTGIKDGRGLLGRCGPNFAADPIIFRIEAASGELQILLVQRKDTGEWALPGGMVDFGERVTKTLCRELGEETGLMLSMDDASIVYRGYVDDPRNTDKAWMETVAAMKLLSEEEAECGVRGGSDAKAAQWKRVDRDLLANLYASHAQFIKLALIQLPVLYASRLAAVSRQILEARE